MDVLFYSSNDGEGGVFVGLVLDRIDVGEKNMLSQ